jgi:hypothetical protein
VMAHELSHVVGDLRHVDPDIPGNLMRKPPLPLGPNLTRGQCAQILDDPDVRPCS